MFFSKGYADKEIIDVTPFLKSTINILFSGSQSKCDGGYEVQYYIQLKIRSFPVPAVPLFPFKGGFMKDIKTSIVTILGSLF